MLAEHRPRFSRFDKTPIDQQLSLAHAQAISCRAARADHTPELCHSQRSPIGLCAAPSRMPVENNRQVQPAAKCLLCQNQAARLVETVTGCAQYTVLG